MTRELKAHIYNFLLFLREDCARAKKAPRYISASLSHPPPPLPQTSALLRLTMDKSGMAKSNYEEKLHSCPRNHLCQRPHNETQGLLKWAWQAQRILIFSSVILSPCTLVMKPFLIEATLRKWWITTQICYTVPRGVCNTGGHTHTCTCDMAPGGANPAKSGLLGLIGVLTKMRRWTPPYPDTEWRRHSL